MLRLGKVEVKSLKSFLAGDAKHYMVDPFEYFAARLTTMPAIQLSDGLVLMVPKIIQFLEDEDIPTHYVESFIAAIHGFFNDEVLPAAVNAYWLLAGIESAHPLVQSAVATWKEEGLFLRIEELARKHHESLVMLIKTNPRLASHNSDKKGMYLPPSTAGGKMPIIIGRQEQDRRARAHDLMDKGIEAERVGDFNTARNCYGKATELLPNDRDIAFANAQIFLKLNEPEVSVRLLTKLCEEVPKSAKFLSALGSSLATVGSFEDALNALDKALDLEPTRPTAIANKATLLNRLNRQAEAAAFLLDAFEGNPPFTPTQDMIQGVSVAIIKCILAILESNDIEMADRLASYLSNINPNDVMTWEIRARVATRVNHPADAIAYYAKALDIDPSRSSAVSACLSLAPSSGMQREAIALAYRYLQSRADDGYIWNDLGCLLAANGDLPKATECYRNATLHAPEDALHWTNLGGSLIQARESAAAISEGIEYLDRAVRMQPDHLAARFNRAAGLFMIGNLRSAEEAFTELLEMDPDFPQVADLLAACKAARARKSKDGEN